MADKEIPAVEYDDPSGRRSDLLAAFDGYEAANPVVEAKGVAPAVIPAAVEEPASEAAETVSPPESSESIPQQSSEAEPAVKPEAVPDSLEPPAHWKVVAKEEFKELPDNAKRIVLNRVKEMDADYTRKTMEVSDLKREYEPVQELFKPYVNQMRTAGYTPATAIQAWMQAEAALTNPATRGQAVRALIENYKIDPQEILGQRAQVAGVVDPNDPEARAKAEIDQILNPYLTPVQQQIKEIEAKLGQFNQFQNNFAQQQRSSQEQQILGQIQSFANAKDAQGNLAHPYYSDVEGDMALIVAGLRNTNQPIPDLEDIYQRAVYSNTATRERLMSAQRNAAATDASAAARAKAANAKRAGSSVTGAAGNAQSRPNGKADERSIRQLIEDAASEHSLQ